MVISSLRGGGAEKVAADLAGRLSDSGHEVTVATWEDADSDVHRVAVNRIVLGHAGPSGSPWRGISAGLRRVRALRAALASTRPDVALAFIVRTGILTALAARPLGIPIVISERCDPRKEPLGLAWRVLRSWAYRRAAAVVPNSSDVGEWLAGWLGDSRVACIPNLVDVPPQPLHPPAAARGPFVLAVGRLEERKGHADLMRAFARCEQDVWNLVILGEGPERSRLDEPSATLAIGDRVHLPGYVQDPWPWVHACDVFALPSYFEGFPNALLEAMAAGKPCVSYDCGAGSREMIQHGRNGCLVPAGDEYQLAARLDELMEDAALRRRLGDAARATRREYAPERIIGQWERVLLSATRGEACTSR